MKKIILLTALFLISLTPLFSQETIKIWNENALHSNGLNDEAEMIIYFPQEKSNTGSTAVLICPGGGYAGINMPDEGHAFAKWLSTNGITGIILKYRLPNGRKEIPFDDAAEAMKIIRANSARWGINESKIGIAGFSAGGHLASAFSNMSSPLRPGFTILFYPVISLEESTRGGTRRNLMGQNPNANDIVTYSANLQVTGQTPPAIIFTTNGDESVSSSHSILYYEALKRNNIPAALYIFPGEGHGWAMLDNYKYTEQSLTLLKNWLDNLSAPAR